MTIHFGNDFDGAVFTPAPTALAGELYAGPNKLLQWLEHQLGLTGYPANAEYLRIELYRQALGQVTNGFYALSFEADRFATAAYLLRWRDELLLSGWDFCPQPDMPPRLQTLAEVEQHFQKKLADPELGAAAKGFADRFAQVLHGITFLPIAVSGIYTNQRHCKNRLSSGC
jgi:hypothetical protein